MESNSAHETRILGLIQNRGRIIELKARLNKLDDQGAGNRFFIGPKNFTDPCTRHTDIFSSAISKGIDNQVVIVVVFEIGPLDFPELLISANKKSKGLSPLLVPTTERPGKPRQTLGELHPVECLAVPAHLVPQLFFAANFSVISIPDQQR